MSPKFFAFFDERYANGAIILGIFGAFLSVIGFLGCCGALKKNDCMIYTFAALLAAIVLAEVSHERENYPVPNNFF